MAYDRAGVQRGVWRLLVHYLYKLPVYYLRFLSLRTAVASLVGHDDFVRSPFLQQGAESLGRRSKMPALKLLCILYIELIRGVPLISLLFMSSIIFPLFLPEGITINKILRAQAAIILFTAAYIAEVVRGGLQGMSRGQYEAAESMGLNYYLTMRLVILPQALKLVIPPTVSILISAFKDTSLVVIIALFDLLKTTQSVLSDPEWMGFSREAYIFIAILYFLGCFSMSNYSRKLERELSTGD
jgi:general L-amino acid transport system permease protein